MSWFLPKKDERSFTPQFAECERVTASPTSPFHIRRIVGGKLFPGGGADTAALCGSKVASDTGAVTLDEVVKRAKHQHLTFTYCAGCLAIVQSIVEEVTSP